ncbi:MAG: hypothetical protein ACI9QL_005247 [Candidatus Omnitrophota bacterium]|jgi:hypothetical protein
MKKLMIACLLIGGAFSAQAEDMKTTLTGHLSSLKDGKVAPHTLQGDPEYFILYSSASW